MKNGGRYKDGRDSIVYYGGDFYEALGTHWVKIDPKLMRRKMYELDVSATPFQVEQAMSVLADKLCIGPGMPQDLGGNVPEDVENLLPLQNGLLHVPSLSLYAPDLDLFTTYCLPYEYDPDARSPLRWLKFLDELWPGDAESKLLLQQWMGYLLLPDTSFEKILLLYGPKRSGKGTIIKTITEMLGKHNVVAATLQSLSGSFGLAPLIGKPLCAISDARLDRRTSAAGVQALLNISGTDLCSINIKHKDAVSIELPTRVMMATNELPSFNDPSGSLAGRFLVLRLVHSFDGKEDRHLRRKLEAELPGILNWALRGYFKLQRDDAFVEPKAGLELVDQLATLGSPVRRFLDDDCDVGPAHEVECGRLAMAYKNWCDSKNERHFGDAQFGKDLAAAVPALKRHRPRNEKGDQHYHYFGVGLKSERLARERAAGVVARQAVTNTAVPLESPLAQRLRESKAE